MGLTHREESIMQKLLLATPLLLMLANPSFAANPTPSTQDFADQQDLLNEIHSFHRGLPMLAFATMYGVDGPFVGDTNPVRGVVGDELPWDVSGFAVGDLDTRGRLRILVHGLVFADEPGVPPNLVGTNDEPFFRGLVSCLTEDGDTVGTQNVVTDGFPANVHGDSYIHATLDLPNPCVAPIAMILAGSEDKWFAVTGFESEGGEASSTQ
jgi:hypothetical protein